MAMGKAMGKVKVTGEDSKYQLQEDMWILNIHYKHWTEKGQTGQNKREQLDNNNYNYLEIIR